MRWLHRVADSADADDGGRLEIDDLVVEHECSLPRSEVLDGALYLSDTREALGRHGVAVPPRIDALIWWRNAVGPRAAILLEVKSGQRPPDHAVYPLLAYRAALRGRFPGRVLVWGIGESQACRLTGVAGAALARGCHEGGDTWIVSQPDDAPEVLRILGR